MNRAIQVVLLLLLCLSSASADLLDGLPASYQSRNIIVPGVGAVPTPLQAVITSREVWIGSFGAHCDGSGRDDTLPIQNAINYAAKINADVWLGGLGLRCLIGQLTIPAAVQVLNAGGFLPAHTVMLHGPGASQLQIVSSVTGTSCALTISATYGVNGTLQGTYSGFGVQQINTPGAGYGICLVSITKASFVDIMVTQFARGIDGHDSILINIDRSFFSTNGTHIRGDITSNSNPNLWNITKSHFDASTNFAISMIGAQIINVEDNDFESNGTAGAGAFTVYLSTLNQSPTVGLNLKHNYFEGNQGTEVYIDQSAFAVKSVHNIEDNTFARTLANQTNLITINNTASASAHTTVNYQGNSYIDVTGGAAITPLATAGGTANYLFNCSQKSNEFNPTTNVSATCLIATTGIR